MLRTSRPCAVTTSGPPAASASEPDGTRKCAHVTSCGPASRIRRRSSRKRSFPPPRRSSTASSISWPRSRSACSSCATNEPRSGSDGPGYICETRRILKRSSRRSCSPHSARRTPQISPIVQRARKCVSHRVEHVVRAARRVAHAVERCRSLVGVPLGAQLRRALELALLGSGIDRLQLDLVLRIGGVLVHADDHALTALDLLLPVEGGALDLVLHQALLDRRDRAADLVDPCDQLGGARLELVGQRLDVVRAAERVGGVGRAGLGLQDLLRAQRDRRGALGRQRERLVERVRVQRLRAAADRRERLDRDAHDVVLGLLRGQGRAAGLRVEAESERLRVRRAEPLAHDARPDAPRRPELRDLLEEVVVRVEEEGQARAEVVGRQTGRDRGVAVGDAVRDRERELLHRGRARLADVVAGDRDRVPRRDALRAVREEIGREPHRRARREDVVPARDVLLEDVVLHRAAKRASTGRPGPRRRARREEGEATRAR